MIRCRQCILPETFPGITFDSEGVCKTCRSFDAQAAQKSLKRLEAKLEDLLSDAAGRPIRYHALVAYSGGKDSTYLIHTMKNIYGLRVLAMTFDNGFLSSQSFANMRTVVEALDVDHIVLKPEASLLRRIFSACARSTIYPPGLLKYGSSICISCIRMVSCAALRTAIEKSIPIVALGNSPGQLLKSENECIYKDNRIPFELRKSLFEPLAEIVGDEVYDCFLLDREHYRCKDFPHTVNPFPLIGYDERRIYETIAKLGWKKPDDVDPNSTNCRLNALGIIRHRQMCGHHPYDYEMSALVRLGIIGRDEALKRIEDPGGRAAAVAARIAEELERPAG